MANTSSAKKRVKVIAKRQLRNQMVKSSAKTAVKKVLVAAKAGDKAQLAEAHRLAVKAIDQAAAKGIFHKNNASRKKSQLAKLVNA